MADCLSGCGSAASLLPFGRQSGRDDPVPVKPLTDCTFSTVRGASFGLQNRQNTTVQNLPLFIIPLCFSPSPTKFPRVRAVLASRPLLVVPPCAGVWPRVRALGV